MAGLAPLAGCCSIGLLVLAYWSLAPVGGVRGRTAAWLSLAGAAVALPVLLLSSYLLDSLGWTSQSRGNGVAIEFLASFALVAALEQGALVIVLWPAYRAHRLERLATAISGGVVAAGGFGVVHAIAVTASAARSAVLLTSLAIWLTRVFAAAIWSTCLSMSHARYRNWLTLAWLVGIGVDGILRHLTEARGTLGRVSAFVLLSTMLVLVGVLRHRMLGERESVIFGRHSLLGGLVDAPRIGTVRAAWQHPHRPALLHWIVGGAFVNFGANILGLALGVAIAHAFGIDLSRVNETEVGAMAPLAILAMAVLLSYPVAAYLTAKASGADSVFEPGVAALISIGALTVLLSMTAPVTMVLALVLAPVAFGLACLGAWLGLSGIEIRSEK